MIRAERTAALTGILLLAGCAAAPPTGPRPPEGLTWGGYLYGEDLRQGCTGEGPDRYRFVINGTEPGRPVRIFEAVGTAEEGGWLEARDVAFGRVSDIGPGEPYRNGAGRKGAGAGKEARLPLDPAQFAALGHRLVTSGLLMPPALAPDVTRGTSRWFATGCHDGFWFLAAHAGSKGPVREVGGGDAPPVSPPRR